MSFPVLIMHCLSCTSDIFVVTGPNDGLAFLLANAGFDVWLGNSRGNNYAQKHISLSPYSVDFWSFSLDEIAKIDIPTKVDYILQATNRSKVHYIGYSQGAAVLMMLLSTNLAYGEKIKSTHLLAPPIFMCHIRTPLVYFLAQFLGEPGPAAELFGTFPSQGATAFLRTLGHLLCKNQQNQLFCKEVSNFFSGWGSTYLNMTILPEILLSTPADGSNRQFNQFLQFEKNL
ncbi:lipase 3-like [Musca domestica]|nr:lipase 3-like [Musca domestica]